MIVTVGQLLSPTPSPEARRRRGGWATIAGKDAAARVGIAEEETAIHSLGVEVPERVDLLDVRRRRIGPYAARASARPRTGSGASARSPRAWSRRNTAAYADLNLGRADDPWALGLAGRYEDFSDFGGQLTGKISDFETLTQGVDVVANYSPGDATNLSLLFNYTGTEVTGRNPDIVDDARVDQLERALPRFRGMLSVLHDLGPVSGLLRGTYFDNPGASGLGARYPESTPFGFNGGYYYMRLTYDWLWGSR